MNDSPQAVVESLHTVLGHSVGPPCGADAPEHAGHVHHAPPRLLDHGQDAEGNGDHAVKVHVQHVLIVVDGEPVARSGGDGHAGVVHHGPQP